jgi:hypothetical protein
MLLGCFYGIMSAFKVKNDFKFATTQNNINLVMGNPAKSVLETIKEADIEAMTYEEYRKLVSDLAATKSNSGPDKTDALAEYTQLNDKRMNRWDKTLKIPVEIQEKISKIDRKLTFLVLTESWCGDASPSLPVMNKIAELNPNITFKIVFRDENLDLMNLFLTNGGMSIPKLIIHEEGEVLANWGPRPSNATKMVEDYKAANGKLSAEFKQELQVWYNKDKGQNILNDIVSLLPLE